MKLIGINGFKRSGKGEVYNTIVDYASLREETAKDKGYADKLKQYAALSLGYTGTPQELYEIGDALKLDGVRIAVERYASGQGQVRDVLVEEDSITGRQYLQHVGNEARNLFGEFFWVDQVTPFDRRTLKQVWEDDRYRLPDYAGITDLRYQNEANRVRTLGGIVIEVVRPGVESDGHASEQRLPRHLVDYTIHNDDTLAVLYDKVAWVLNDAREQERGEVQC